MFIWGIGLQVPYFIHFQVFTNIPNDIYKFNSSILYYILVIHILFFTGYVITFVKKSTEIHTWEAHCIDEVVDIFSFHDVSICSYSRFNQGKISNYTK